MKYVAENQARRGLPTNQTASINTPSYRLGSVSPFLFDFATDRFRAQLRIHTVGQQQKLEHVRSNARSRTDSHHSVFWSDRRQAIQTSRSIFSDAVIGEPPVS